MIHSGGPFPLPAAKTPAPPQVRKAARPQCPREAPAGTQGWAMGPQCLRSAGPPASGGRAWRRSPRAPAQELRKQSGGLAAGSGGVAPRGRAHPGPRLPGPPRRPPRRSPRSRPAAPRTVSSAAPEPPSPRAQPARPGPADSPRPRPRRADPARLAGRPRRGQTAGRAGGGARGGRGRGRAFPRRRAGGGGRRAESGSGGILVPAPSRGPRLSTRVSLGSPAGRAGVCGAGGSRSARRPTGGRTR